MTTAFFSKNLRFVAAVILLGTSAVLSAADRKFSTSTSLSTEARTLIQLLEQAHFNRDAVKSSDYTEVISAYMGDLDGQRLFFLASDKSEFEKKYGNTVYENASFLGNIDAAYQIYATYETHATTRINWVFDELKKDFDLTTDATYRTDRTKADWPSNPVNADELWHTRLKFELVAELLNKKPIEEAKKTVRKRYEQMLKSLSETEGRDLAEIYLGCIARLYDPHSTYFSPETFEEFGIQMKLQLVGIGAMLAMEDDNCIVKELVPGGPADLGRQLKPNDRIISVGQTGAEPVEVIGMKLRKVVEMIRGEKGSQVYLFIQPADATDPSARRTIIITRDVVKLNSQRAHAAIFQVPAADDVPRPLGVITLPTFYGPAADGDTDSDGGKTGATQDIARLIGKLKEAGIDGLVLDLRRNGGGYLNEAIDLAGLFIKSGPVVQVKDYTGSIQIDGDKSSAIAYTGPLAVLVDRFSASASEIVAGALQNYGRAIVIGDTSTHGKGTVQTVMEMKNISRLLANSPAKTGAAKITIQKFYLPGGASTQLKGVVPDIVLPSIDDYLPIGEASLPHALIWDQIPTSFFDGSPLEPKVLSPLRRASLERQNTLEEFDYLRRNIDWFKLRLEAQKLVSLNLDNRQKQKAADAEFRKTMKAERDRLAGNDFGFKEYRLGPPPAPRIKAPKKDDDEGDDTETAAEENQSYPKLDIHLREAFRVIVDAMELGKSRDFTDAAKLPLTAKSKS
jgi:carboxyl-terminal processing protease